jgi:hypothetical protein
MQRLKFILLLPVRAFVWLCRLCWHSITHMFQGQYLFASARLFIALFSLFLMIGIPFYVAGLIFGFDGLGMLDRLEERHGGQIATAGDLLFRVASGLVLLICMTGVYLVIRDQIGKWRRRRSEKFIASPRRIEAAEKEKPAGCGCLVVSIIVGYFAWFGLVYST